MIKYVKTKEMLLDNLKNGIMVVEVNAQGILELDVVARRLLTEFPDVATKYRAACHQAKVIFGDVLTYEERGYRLALCVTAQDVAGKTRDDNETVLDTTLTCIDKLARKFPNETFYSGIMSRTNKNWGKIYQYLHQKDKINWVIYPD